MGLLSIDPMTSFSFILMISPLLLSMFIVFNSILNNSLGGIYWLIGVLIAQAFGYLGRFGYAKIKQTSLDKQFRKLVKNGMTSKQAYDHLVNKANESSNSKRAWWTKNNQKIRGSNFRDMCSLFIQPYANTLYGQFTMPSLNAVFHMFTIVFFAVSTYSGDGNQSLGSTILLLILSIIFLLDMLMGISKKCFNWKDAIAGAIVGGGIGAGWWGIKFALEKNLGEGKLSIFSKKSGLKTCSIDSQKRFRCLYDDDNGKPAEENKQDVDDAKKAAEETTDDA